MISPVRMRVSWIDPRLHVAHLRFSRFRIRCHQQHGPEAASSSRSRRAPGAPRLARAAVEHDSRQSISALISTPATRTLDALHLVARVRERRRQIPVVGHQQQPSVGWRPDGVGVVAHTFPISSVPFRRFCGSLSVVMPSVCWREGWRWRATAFTRRPSTRTRRRAQRSAWCRLGASPADRATAAPGVSAPRRHDGRVTRGRKQLLQSLTALSRPPVARRQRCYHRDPRRATSRQVHGNSGSQCRPLQVRRQRRRTRHQAVIAARAEP